MEIHHKVHSIIEYSVIDIGLAFLMADYDFSPITITKVVARTEATCSKASGGDICVKTCPGSSPGRCDTCHHAIWVYCKETPPDSRNKCECVSPTEVPHCTAAKSSDCGEECGPGIGCYGQPLGICHKCLTVKWGTCDAGGQGSTTRCSDGHADDCDHNWIWRKHT